MTLSKRERVIRTLEISGEPDKIPIHNPGFEKTASSYQVFIKSREYSSWEVPIKPKLERNYDVSMRDLAEIRFWNADCHDMDPFGDKLISKILKNPLGSPDLLLNPLNGKLYDYKPQVGTGFAYRWYVDGYFKTPEKLYSSWETNGKPLDYINDDINYSSRIWSKYVEFLAPHVYPMARLPIAMHESLFEGMTIGTVIYYMRKQPGFIHDVIFEYLKVNLEIIRRLAEAGVDIAFYYDDLGFKGRSIFSLKHFKEFILPYYKKLYQECKKAGMFIVQHSCGFIDELLPYMVNAGLNCIQALEPAAGVNLGALKDELGDKIAFMGGMDSSKILNFGTPQDVENNVKKCIKEGAKGGGYFAGPSHNILNAPWENIIALRAALEKYRCYPINF